MKIIFTTASINNNYEERMLEYKESLNITNLIAGVENVNVLECYSKKSDIFEPENFKNKIYYSETDIPGIRNKGVKEAMAIKKFIDSNRFDYDELIIKQTGRYRFTSDFFIRSVILNENNKNCDVITRRGENNQCFFGAIGIRFRHLVEFIDNLDLIKMEINMINIESELSEFIQYNKLNEITYNNIDMFSNINNEHKFNW
jgi:hypothetical protein